jgi:hypothetical protein
MAVYCGVDFHPRQQSVSYCDAGDGGIHYRELHHERDDLHGSYSRPTGEVIAGPEASGYGAWFERLLAGPGHQVWPGDAAEIRRRSAPRPVSGTSAGPAKAARDCIRGYIILRDRVDYEEFPRRGVEARPARLAT